MSEEKKYGRILTKEERKFCNKNKLTIGWDDDDETKYQYSHITKGRRALCKTNRLWFYGGTFDGVRGGGKTKIEEDNRISCEKCLVEFEKIYKKSTEKPVKKN